MSREDSTLLSTKYKFVEIKLVNLEDKIGIKIITDFDALYELADVNEYLAYKALGILYIIIEDHFSEIEAFKQDLPNTLFGDNFQKEMTFIFNKVNQEGTHIDHIIEVMYESICQAIINLEKELEEDEKTINKSNESSDQQTSSEIL